MSNTATRIPAIYLAGAIRDDHPEDIEWREKVIGECESLAVFLNPLAGKVFNPLTREWLISGLPSVAKVIVKQDFWCIDRADIVVFHFGALSQKYPNIGTLVEFGRATARGCLIYSIINKEYTGHENRGMFRLHPFLEENSSVVFPSLEECITFLRCHLRVLSGWDPHYKGPIGQEGLNPLYGGKP